nr:retrotransposon protein, putative, Ty1-copia subclass [Tanacetum cinerariifolium]
MVYFSVVPRDGIFEIDLYDSYTNVSSMYALSNKRAKSNLDSALLWHYRLGHISKKLIEKLQHDGLLNLTDLKAFEKCVPCMSGKMVRKPYTHQVERAKDLLGLIHTDVYGPFKIVSRQGASYFVTFTDDFSCYGYVYLLKHKHEVFETFKVFQTEVENQLGKTIKLLRSDRGGEYISQEFLKHLKEHWIIAHRTPPYTSQHNGVSERRNRTLLDMVRSIVSSILVGILPLSHSSPSYLRTAISNYGVSLDVSDDEVQDNVKGKAKVGDEDLSKPFKRNRKSGRVANAGMVQNVSANPRRFRMLKACDKDLTGISKIARKANETLPHFKERWVSESNAIPNVPELMQISSFMSSHKCPELAKRFSDSIPKTVDEMLKRVDDYLQSKEAFRGIKLPRVEFQRRDTPVKWIQRND